MYDPATGYSQGMSDLVAPILAEVLDESDTFWCFVGLMQNTIFVSSPRDEDMEKQLVRRGHERGQGAGRQVLEAACGVAAVGHRAAEELGHASLMGTGGLSLGLRGRTSSPERDAGPSPGGCPPPVVTCQRPHWGEEGAPHHTWP